MDKVKFRDLYAVLGLTSQHVSQNEIRVAYEKLVAKFDPDRKVVRPSPDAVEFVKVIESAYDILGDPEKRAEYDQSRARVHHEVKNSPERTGKPGQKLPLDEQFPAARGQLQLQTWKRPRARRTPPRPQLRVQAQLRAHGHRLAKLQQQVQAQGLRETMRQIEVGSDEEFENVWAWFSQIFEAAEAVHEDNKRKEEEGKEALARQAAEQEAKLREEEAAREEAAAAQAQAKEIEWINQEAEESILVLAGMGERPMATLTTGYAQMLHEDYVRRLVEKTDDLLDYLWDKAHSGDWICPKIKEGIDLDRLLGLVLNREAQESYFPSATKDLAASLLRKWRGEECDETDDSTSPAEEATSQPCSDSESSEGGSSTEESEAEGESSSVDLQSSPQAAEPHHSPFAQNANQPSPFAQNAHKKPPLASNNQQYNIGTVASFAGWKRVRSPAPYEEQENQWSKKQKHIGCV
ncbi:hypothetical protein INS49_011027 [Diaporthe citri]|uniref:uncharacterized protein n=1 Tax=Diaporthe citri TaxID=83186 RepID=UPI001C7EA974|nr:uncharacterized protein INS49_011027 [Diaporthe citri]KAG6359973.1 hypothetical protein INS49_011027 [Diaporthe citri]